MNADDPRHGKPSGYDQHRRDDETACTACKDAAAAYEYRRRIDGILGRSRTVPAIGTARRIQALIALGYTYGQIGDALDRSHDWPAKLANGRQEIVRATTAKTVDDLFRRWCMTPAPEKTSRQKWSASYARSVARKNGWVPPLAWDDIDNDPHPVGLVDEFRGYDDVETVIVDRLLLGERVDSTRAEKEEALRRWLADGGSERELCIRMGWKQGRYSRRKDAA